MVSEGSSARGINRQQRVHGDEVGEEGVVERGESGMWRTVLLQAALFGGGIDNVYQKRAWAQIMMIAVRVWN